MIVLLRPMSSRITARTARPPRTGFCRACGPLTCTVPVLAGADTHSWLVPVAVRSMRSDHAVMVFYPQGAVIDKRLSAAAIRRARQDTASGAVVTQLIVIAVVITAASTIGLHHLGTSLSSVGQISGGLSPYLGRFAGTVLFGLGMLGRGPGRRHRLLAGRRMGTG
jgi:hypothetical protein